MQQNPTAFSPMQDKTFSMNPKLEYFRIPTFFESLNKAASLRSESPLELCTFCRIPMNISRLHGNSSSSQSEPQINLLHVLNTLFSKFLAMLTLVPSFKS